MTKFQFPQTVVLFAGLLTGGFVAEAQTPVSTVPVQMTVTLNVLGNGKRMPVLNREDIFVKQRNDKLRVTDWVAACGDRAGLDLFVLIDDASDSGLGIQLADLRAFIEAQPPTTLVAVGYMQNASVRIAQDFTNDHTAAAKSVRLPLGSPGAYGSPYLSVIDLMKRWPDTTNRHEVIMIADGIDRAGRGMRFNGLSPASPDMNTASTLAQRTGTIIHTIYSPGVGRWHHSFWAGINGQNALAQLSDETGGESFSLGLQPPVSFKPYLDRIRTILENQYLLTFDGRPAKKPGLQSVTLTTEMAGVELVSSDNFWLAAAKQ